MQEIIIDGVNLNEMKVKHDVLQAEMAAARGKIRQGASKFIADSIEKVKKFVEEILGEDDDELEDMQEIDFRAEQAVELLKAAQFVSEVSGVSFDLPYYDRQAEYYPDGTPYSRRLEESDNTLVSEWGEAVSKLYNLLESMESDVSDWNTSYC